ncbi:hypothetical protein FACS1894113_3190 [Alphaproteobacteria bacterium]|nr:hypothetical protein FACS1894113_3190 [Alphaproteobacteria bacterium]
MKWHFRLESILENEYLSKIIDMDTEVFENETGKSILKKKYRYVCNDYSSSKIYLLIQVISDKNIENEYVAGICDDSEKAQKNIYNCNDIVINSYKTLSIS